MARHGTAQHGTAQHGTAQHVTAQRLELLGNVCTSGQPGKVGQP